MQRKLPVAASLLWILNALPSALAAPSDVDWDFILDQNGGSRVHLTAELGAPSTFARGAEEVMPPASLTKLFTAGAALERLGADYRFETRLEWRTPDPTDPGIISHLTLVGSGDPSWGMPDWNETARSRFDQIAQTLKDQKVREVHGPIRFTASDSRWALPTPPVGWLPEDLDQCEGALPQAFNVQLNCATLVVESPMESHWEAEGVNTPVKLNIDWGPTTSLHATRDGAGYKVWGTWDDQTRAFRVDLPVPDTLPWAKALLMKALQANGIALFSNSPENESGLFVLHNHSVSLYSPALKDLLKPMLRDNVNFIGESMFLALGGRDALREYLNTHLPEEKTLALWDGSGLSRSNTASAHAVFSLLEHLRKSPDFPFIWEALAVAGVDGTLSSRMKGTEAEGILRGRTGYLNGYFHLAGYVPRYDASGVAAEFIPFVFLSSTPSGRPKAAKAAQDRVGAALVRSANY